MKKIINLFFAIVMFLNFALLNIGYCASNDSSDAKSSKKVAAVEKTINETLYKCANALDIVNNPKVYLNKKIKLTAKFDKFSTLGLDYKPAFRDSKDYISFLIQRDDISDHVVPLSEMKLFLKRKEAEKFIDLESSDKIEIFGTVFSCALNDPWIEVDKINILSSKAKKKD